MSISSSASDAVEALRANLALCGAAPSRYHVHHERVVDVLGREPNPAADATVLFADPPYDADLQAELLDALRPERFPRLELAVIEHRSKRAPGAPRGFRVERVRRFGDTMLTDPRAREG
jgi:16S rRNA G966 N2-methylase RsmD